MVTEGWIERTLDDVAEVLMGQSPPGDSYNTQGSGLPFIQGSAEFGVHTPSPVKWCSQPAKVAEIGDLMVSVRAPVGDTNFADQRIAIGRGLAIVRAKPGAMTEFLRLVIQNETAALLAASGSGMFSSITAANLRGFTVSLPALPVQRRIVDLMARVDHLLSNLEAERAATDHLIQSSLEDWDRLLFETPIVTLASLCSPRSGPSWSASDESANATPESVRVVKITNTRPDGSLDMSEGTYVVGVPATAVRLSDRSLVLIRTNGNRDRIGNVYRPSPEAYGCVVSAFQFAAVFASVEIRDWVYWWLKAPARQAAMSEAASGTTGLGNLAAGWLKALDVPWPDEGTRLRLIETVESLATHRASLETEAKEVRSLRQALLQALLAGKASIPEAYDALLQGTP